MKKLEIIDKIPKLPLPNISHSDVQIIVRLVTVLAATHLANKVDKIVKEINNLEHPDDVLRFLK